MPGARAATMLARLRVEARDVLELLLLPGLAAVLPWRWSFALFRRMAGWPWLYRAQCMHALAQAQGAGMAPDAARWLREYRLVILTDHADHYLARTRSDAWLRRHVRATGDWGVAPGQAAVLYLDDRVIAGGWIEDTQAAA